MMKRGDAFSTFFWGMVSLLNVPCYPQAETVDYGSSQALFGKPVTINATGTLQRVSVVPATMAIITADEIRQSSSNLSGLIRRKVFILRCNARFS